MAKNRINQKVTVELNSPLPDSFDNKEVRDIMSEAGIIPYFGYNDHSSHIVLQYFADLYQWSPTNRACINAIRDYAFRGNIRLKKSTVGGFDLGEQNIYATSSEVQGVIETFTKLGMSATDISELTRQLYINLAVFGNLYLRLTIKTIAGVSRVYLESIPAQNAAYQLEKDANGNLVDMPERKIVVSESFEKQYLAKFPPKTYHIYPYWSELDKGEYSTVFHIKNQTDKSPYYGRPDSISSYLWQYLEYYIADKAVTISRQDFVALYLLFSEAPLQNNDETDDDFEGWTAALKGLTTMSNSGKASTLANLRYPNGTEKPHLEKLDIKLDTEDFRVKLEKAASKIIQSHGWFAELLGEQIAKNGIGKDSALLTTYTVADGAKITPLQEDFSAIWHKVFSVIDEQVGTNLAEFTIEFPQNITKLAAKLKDLNAVQTTVTDGNATD